MWNIPLSDIDYGQEEVEAIERVLKNKWLSMGAEVEKFEVDFSTMMETKHAIAVSSATAALHLALLAVGVGTNDEVIQPALNFVASANMTVACGASPTFGDVISLTEPTIDPAHVAELITPRVKALIVMHYGGNLCRMVDLYELCKRHKIPLIEDACHAVGARYHCKLQQQLSPSMMAGAIGDIGCFSFFANKNMTTGEGGMLVTQNDEVASKLRLLRSHGMTSLTWQRHLGHARSYEVVANGYNYRLDEIHAALGRVQLKKLPANNKRRRDLLRCYRQAIDELDGWAMPFSDSIEDSAGHLMVAIAPTNDARDQAAERLRNAGIQSSMHYPCISDLRAFLQFSSSRLPVTREFVSRVITLPLYPAMNEQDVERIFAVLRERNRIPVMH